MGAISVKIFASVVFSFACTITLRQEKSGEEKSAFHSHLLHKNLILLMVQMNNVLIDQS